MALFSASMAEKIASLILIVVTTGITAKALGPANFGILSYAQSFNGLISGVAALGIGDLVISIYQKNRSQVADIIGCGILLRAIAGTICVVTSPFWIQLISINHNQAQVMSVLALISLLQAPLIAEQILSANYKLKAIILVRICNRLAASAALITCSAYKCDTIWFAWVYAGESFLTASCFIFTAYKLEIIPWKLTASRHRILSIWGAAWPLAVSALFVGIYFRIEQLILVRYASATEIGSYYAAMKLFSIHAVILSAFHISIMPTLSKSHLDHIQFKESVADAMILASGIGWSIAFAIAIGSRLIIPVLFGREYSNAATICSIMAIGIPFLFTGMVRHQFFVISGKTKLHTIFATIGIACNLGLGLILAKRFGATGVATASLLSSIISGYFTSSLIKYDFSVFRMTSLGLAYGLSPIKVIQSAKRLTRGT